MNDRTLVITLPESLGALQSRITALLNSYADRDPWFTDVVVMVPGWPHYPFFFGDTLQHSDSVNWTDPCHVEQMVKPWADSKAVESKKIRLSLGIKSTDILEIAFRRESANRKHAESWRLHPMNPEALARSEFWNALSRAASIAMAVTGSDRWFFDAEFMTASHYMGGTLNRTAQRRMQAHTFLRAFRNQFAQSSVAYSMMLYSGRMDALQTPGNDIWSMVGGADDMARFLGHPYQNNRWQSRFEPAPVADGAVNLWYPSTPNKKSTVHHRSAVGAYYHSNNGASDEFPVETVKQWANDVDVWVCATHNAAGRVCDAFATTGAK